MLYTKWRQKTDGGVLVLLAIALVPLILIVGLAVDSAVNSQVKRRVQNAVDAAARAGAINGQGVLSTITSQAQAVFNANINGISGVGSPNISYNSSLKAVTVTVSVSVPNTFMNVAGLKTTAFNVSGTYKLPTIQEVVIFIEASLRSPSYFSNVVSQLMNFINALPSTTMVSIIPVAGEFSFSTDTTVSSALFNNLSNTTNDESVMPAHYPLSLSLTWNNNNYTSVANLFYVNNFYNPNGMLFTNDTLLSYQKASQCPGAYTPCPSTYYSSNCPSTTRTSCTSTYNYNMNKSFPMLPLTMNRTLIKNYINNLSSYSPYSDAFFPSHISWAWRLIDPSWNNFWQTNSSSTSMLLSAGGSYPGSYASTVKSVVIIAYDSPYWNEFSWAIRTYYSKNCGNRTTRNGDSTLIRSTPCNAYGAYPVPTDYYSRVYDITCENYNYKTIDQTLGLAYTASNNWQGTLTLANYQSKILSEVGNKFNRICSSMKEKGINMYVLSQNNLSFYTENCVSCSNGYDVSNTTNSINTALLSVATQISAQ